MKAEKSGDDRWECDDTEMICRTVVSRSVVDNETVNLDEVSVNNSQPDQ